MTTAAFTLEQRPGNNAIQPDAARYRVQLVEDYPFAHAA